MNKASYRTILRSSSLMAGAQVASIAANLLKMKFVALFLGPFGVGLAGLYVSLIQTASTISALGLGVAGTRRIAATSTAEGEDEGAFERVRRTLMWAGMALALIGAGAFWLASGWIARETAGDAARAADICWLAVGVGLTVAASAQTALLSGLRRIGDLAKVQAAAGISGALLGVVAVHLWGEHGLVAMVLVVPLVTLLLGHVFAARTPRGAGPRPAMWAMLGEFGMLATLGFSIMLSQMATLVGHLLVRVLVQRELGTDALGHFQAAWAISVTYVGFVLTAMGTDYFPRLSAVLAEPGRAKQLVNEQTEVALLLCGPVLIAILGLSPWVMVLLYSSDFGPSVDVLRWQMLGDVLKIMSWPLGFVLLAAGAGKTFVTAEVISVSVFVLGVQFGLPLFGVDATGIAFLAMYLLYLPLIVAICAIRFGIVWSREVMLHALSLAMSAVLVVIVAHISDIAAGALGVAIAGLLGIWALVRISRFSSKNGGTSPLIRAAAKVMAWIKL